MITRIFSILAISSLILAGSPALADWQYTRWGMTPNEVLAASEGAAVRLNVAEHQRRQCSVPLNRPLHPCRWAATV